MITGITVVVERDVKKRGIMAMKHPIVVTLEPDIKSGILHCYDDKIH